MSSPPERHPVPDRLDPVALGAALLIALGWFAMSTLVTRYAGLRLSFHFYDVWSVLEHPARLFTGLGDGDGATRIAFGVLCVAAVLTVLVPLRLAGRSAWLTYLVPLALMVACALVFHERTSGAAFADAGRHGALGSKLVALANTLAGRADRTMARHVALGLGAYVSFLASLVLAWRGLAGFRAFARASSPSGPMGASDAANPTRD